MIDLLGILSEYHMFVTRIVEFIVVDAPLVYTEILGRLILIVLGVVSLVRHLSVKFPTLREIRTVKGDQLASRECYHLSPEARGR